MMTIIAKKEKRLDSATPNPLDRLRPCEGGGDDLLEALGEVVLVAYCELWCA